MYAGGRPNDEARAIQQRFASSWIPRLLPIACVLHVRGRVTGKVVDVPLVIVPWRGHWYVASMLGPDVNWVHNVRAADGAADLLHGRTRPVHLVEVPAPSRPPILRRYLLFAMGARPHVAVSWNAPIDELRAVAERYPVFRVDPRADGTTRPTAAQLLAAIGDVVHDLPAFVGAPLFRRRHLRWGATADEVTRALPGDNLVPGAQFRATRAITIDAPPAAVWPWLVQVGAGRAGWYSNDLLDNLGRPSATSVIPSLQRLAVGQWVPMSPSGPPSERNAFQVDRFEQDRFLLWAKPDSTWAWQLAPGPAGGTRLVTRLRARYDWGHPARALGAVVLMEMGDFAMQRRMLRGIKARAEARGAVITDRDEGR